MLSPRPTFTFNLSDDADSARKERMSVSWETVETTGWSVIRWDTSLLGTCTPFLHIEKDSDL